VSFAPSNAVVPILFLGAVIFFLGSSNPVTPAGYVGYLTRGAVMGHERFVGLQTGPTSSGRGWLLHVINVSVTPYTYDEDFSGPDTVLSSDSLKIAFRVHLVWKVRPDRVKEFVENFSTLNANDSPDRIVEVAYRNFLREPLRTYARDEVQKYKGLEIKDNIARIGDTLTARVLELSKDTPFEVRSIVVAIFSTHPR
jgi:peptidoglycan hydrolase-like protein with peptidoglycan-binding domain